MADGSQQAMPRELGHYYGWGSGNLLPENARRFMTRVWRASKKCKAGIARSGRRIAPALGAATFLSIMACTNLPTLASWFGANVFSSIFGKIRVYLGRKTAEAPTSNNRARESVVYLDEAKLQRLIEQLDGLLVQECGCNRQFGEQFVDGVKRALMDNEISRLLPGSFEFIRNDLKALGDEVSDLRRNVDKVIEEIDKLHEEHTDALKWVRECGLRDIGEIVEESHRMNIDRLQQLEKRFLLTSRVNPEELMALIINSNIVIERDLEEEVIRRLSKEHENVLILGEGGSGKSTLLIKVCYKMWLKGWTVLFANERIDATRARLRLRGMQGAKIAVVIDRAALYDECFSFLENVPNSIRIVMAEQDLAWEAKRRSVAGYNFKQLGLKLTEKECKRYLDVHDITDRKVRELVRNESKGLLAVMALLVTRGKGEHSIKKLIDDVWSVLDDRERQLYYPLLLVSSYNSDYPERLFRELHSDPIRPEGLRFSLERLRQMGLVYIEGGRISALHPIISKKLLNEKCGGISKSDEIEMILTRIENCEEYFDFSFSLGTYIAMENDAETLPLAISFLENCAVIDPLCSEVFHNWGIALALGINLMGNTNAAEAESKYAEACKRLNIAFQIGPQTAELLTDWGTTLYSWALLIRNRSAEEATDKLKEASEKHELATKVNPRHAISFYNWGTTLAELASITEDKSRLLAIQQYENACEKYERAAEFDPYRIETLNNWGLTLSHLAILLGEEHKKRIMDLYEQACRKHQQAATVDSSYPETFVNWALAINGLALELSKTNPDKAARKFGEACDKYRLALRVNPNFAKAFYGWGTTLFRWAMLIGTSNRNQALRKYKEACEKYRRATEIDPEYADAFDNWGNTLLCWADLVHDDNPDAALEKYEESCRKHEKAIEVNRQHVNAFCNLAVSLCRLAGQIEKENPKKAIDMYITACDRFMKGTEINPQNADAFCNWGSTLFHLASLIQQDNHKKAIENYHEGCEKYRKATELNPKHIMALSGWASTLSACADLLEPSDASEASRKRASAVELMAKAAFLSYRFGDVDNAVDLFRSVYDSRNLADPAICYECGVAYAAILTLKREPSRGIIRELWEQNRLISGSARSVLDCLYKGKRSAKITEIRDEKDFTFESLLEELRD